MKNNGIHIFRLTIARKLLFGFLSCGFFTVFIALIALSSLQRLNQINNRIIQRDVPLVETADKLAETLLAQELYGRRSLILKNPGIFLIGVFSRTFQNLNRLPFCLEEDFLLFFSGLFEKCCSLLLGASYGFEGLYFFR